MDSVVVVLATWLVLGAYITAYAYVQRQGQVVEPARTAGVYIVNAAWGLLTLYLFTVLAIGLGEGRAWNRALPEGHTGTFTAALLFGAAWIVDDAFWSKVFGLNGIGLEALFTPPHLVEMAAVAVIASGPLRAAARRGEAVAGPVTLASSAIFLSVLTFATQFAHPLIDPWATGNYEFRNAAMAWIGENLGVAGILIQAVILAGTGLLLNSGFKLRPGSMTFVFLINGVLVAITKSHFQFLPVLVATGVAADAWIAWTSRRPGKPSASLCAIIGGTFAGAYVVEVALLPAGDVWGASLSVGAIIAATTLTWMMGRLLRAGLPAAVFAPYEAIPVSVAPVPERWTLDPANDAREQLVRSALDDLGTPEALGRSPLARLPAVAEGASAATELRELLIDVITELASSPVYRDAQAGNVLLDYYVKRVGSHEVVMERLHMSHATYYRRLSRGYELVGDRIDQLSIAARVAAKA